MADIFREVEEDLRRDQTNRLWKKYGGYAIAVAAVIILATGGWQAWQAYELSQRTERSNSFETAMGQVAAGDVETALTNLAEIRGNGGNGYGALAAFEEARLLADGGDVTGAVTIWDSIAANQAVGEGLQGVATLLAVLHQMEGGDPSALLDRLAPLAVDGQPYRPSALELSALLALRQNDKAAARDHYTAIVDDRSAPAGLRARAAQMLTALKE